MRWPHLLCLTLTFILEKFFFIFGYDLWVQKGAYNPDCEKFLAMDKTNGNTTVHIGRHTFIIEPLKR